MNNHLVHINNELFGNRLRMEREKRNLTLGEMTNQTNIPKSSLSYYESGKAIPSLDKTYDLAEFFGVSLDYLVGRDEFLYQDNKTKAINNLSDVALLLMRLNEFDCLNIEFDWNNEPSIKIQNDELKAFLKELIDFNSICVQENLTPQTKKMLNEGFLLRLNGLKNTLIQKK